ncbi:MAG TPA: TetR/AcrR family transcriptional regulator [Kineosporiaceae bacterium]|nr:TetR/AcrR family transcriptional regulator [Kineosporiaceae bacterium]
MISPPLPTTPAESRPDAALPVRQRLLRVTSRLVYRHGVSATGVASITAAAGVAKMSLYRHFPGGKDELVAAALADQSERAVTHLIGAARSTAAARANAAEATGPAPAGTPPAGGDPAGGDPAGTDPAGTDPVAVVLAIFDVIDATTQRPGWHGCPFLNAAAELPEDHPGRAVVLAYKEQLRTHLTGLLREAGATKEAADRLAKVLLLLYQGAMSAGGLTPAERPGLLARSVAADLLAREFPPAA